MTRTDSSLQLVDAIEQARLGEDLMVRCPAHEDGTASLHVSRGAKNDGSVVLRCFADCEPKAILDAVNLTWGDLFSDVDSGVSETVWTPAGNASNVYVYRDAHGNPVYEVLRVPQPGGRKTFFQRRWEPGNDRPIWKLDGVERVLYRLPQILKAVAEGKTIYVPEGEKDVETLVSLGEEATTNAQGAGVGKWLPQFSETLAGARVVLLADADQQGRAHMREVREQLTSHGCLVEIREAPAPYKDVTALVQAGGSLNDMLVVVPFEETQREKFGIDILDVITRTFSPTEFVIPAALARKERLIVTGFEGQGKSELLRQWAVQVAAGIHPFTLADMEPQKVLLIDAENEPGQTLQSWQNLLGLAAYHNHAVERGQLIILEEWDNSDLDLAGGDGTAWLHERIHGYQPDLCLMGPLTNMVGRDLKDDEPVRRLKRAINSARSICGTAFILEHHAPHKGPSDKRRSIRPYGSSMFLKWPDYGYGLLPDQDQDEGHYLWERFRWPRVRSRAWPAAMRWGTPNTAEWPWVEDID